MSEVKIFNNSDFGEIRTLEINGEPWFVGKDVAVALGYKNQRDALRKHVDDEDEGVAKCDTLGGSQDLTIINESGLYSLILSCKLQKAKEFKRWVTSEVLPSIRKHGMYIQQNLTFEQTMEIAELVKRTPHRNMEHVFRVLNLFIPELEIPEGCVKTIQGAKVVKQDRLFKDELNKFFEDNNMTLGKFSKKTGIAKSNLSNWLSGKVTPSMSNLKLICDVMNVDLNIFLK